MSFLHSVGDGTIGASSTLTILQYSGTRMDPEPPASDQATPVLPVDDLPLEPWTPTAAAVPLTPSPLDRVVALFEIVLCSDFPTQLLLLQLFTMLGMSPRGADDTLSLTFVVAL